MGFSERFPRWLTGLLGVAQLLITAAIVALELKSDYIDLAHGTIWAGLWSSIIFIITFSMMLTMTFCCCCCRGRCCAIYILIFNILSGLLACVIIYFDRIFIGDLCKCYLGDQICCALRGIPTLKANYTAVFEDCGDAIIAGTISTRLCPSVPYEKLIYVQAQLGCAVGMLVTCGLYTLLVLFACFGVCFGHKK